MSHHFKIRVQLVFGVPSGVFVILSFPFNHRPVAPFSQLQLRCSINSLDRQYAFFVWGAVACTEPPVVENKGKHKERGIKNAERRVATTSLR